MSEKEKINYKMTPAQETELCTCLESMIEEAETLSDIYRVWNEDERLEGLRTEIARARAILKEVRG